MSRHDLTDREFNAIRHFFPAQKKRARGRPWSDHRMVINGILWILATGSPWRDLPEEFGKWQTVYGRAWLRNYPASRCTPTIEDHKLYVTSGMGEIACINADNGEIM